MTYGLRAWGPDGTLWLDESHRITRHIETIYVTVPLRSSYIDVTRTGISTSSHVVFPSGKLILPIINNGFIRCYAAPAQNYNYYNGTALSGYIYLFGY